MNQDWADKNKRMQSLIGKEAGFREGLDVLFDLRGDLFGQITSAFGGNLKSIVIPSSVTEIKDSAFERCYMLEQICYEGSESDWSSIRKAGDWDLFTGNYTVAYDYTAE